MNSMLFHSSHTWIICYTVFTMFFPRRLPFPSLSSFQSALELLPKRWWPSLLIAAGVIICHHSMRLLLLLILVASASAATRSSCRGHFLAGQRDTTVYSLGNDGSEFVSRFSLKLEFLRYRIPTSLWNAALFREPQLCCDYSHRNRIGDAIDH